MLHGRRSDLRGKTGWRYEREGVIADVHRSIGTRKRFALAPGAPAFVGPGYLVAVGYMDPGNWSTSLAGGSKFGYSLLAVALLSNLVADRAAVAMRAPCHCFRSRSGAGMPRRLSALGVIPLWLCAEVAIIATDIAEVIGTAIQAQPLVRHSTRTRRPHHRARRLPHPLPAEDRLPLDRSLRHPLQGYAVCFGIQIFLADPQWEKSS